MANTPKAMRRFGSKFLTLLLVATALGFASRGNALAEGYFRGCTTYAPDSARPVHPSARDLKHEKIGESPASNAEIATQVQRRLGLLVPPAIVARATQEFERPAPPHAELVVLSDLNAVTPHWWQATVADDGKVSNVSVAQKGAFQAVTFARGMAAYAVLNDFLGGDVVPRAGCVALFKFWFSEFPAIDYELAAAVVAEPAQDPHVIDRIRTAWNAFHPSMKSRGYALTSETVRTIGKNPPIAVVYSDPGLPGDGIGRIDVVRIGGTRHTYAMLLMSKDLRFADVYCITPDARCSEYYLWP